MQAPVDFAEITAETPTLSTVTAEYQVIQMQFNQAQTSEQRKSVIEQWDALRRRLSTWKELTRLHFHQDTQNPEYKTALDYCSELSPSLIALEVDLKRQLIHSRDRAELEKSLGRKDASRVYCVMRSRRFCILSRISALGKSHLSI